MLNGNRRSDLEVVADMLRVQGSQTAIMYGANLSYAQTRKYLNLLSDLAIIESVDGKNGRRQYRPTPRGQEFLGLIEKLQQMLV